jgi:uncharacterized protein YeaO (DUF488 family)
MPKPSIEIERAYDSKPRVTGLRFLIDRLWPRGVRKEALHLDGWLKDVAPSTGLRQWFGHDPERFAEFKKRYEAELAAKPQAWQPLLDAAKKEPVILVFGARDPEHNHALVLCAFLRRRLPRTAKK